jgi:hypothetical protein
MSVPNFKIWFYDYDDSVVCYNYEEKQFEGQLIPPTGINSFYLPKHEQLKMKEKKKMTDTDFNEYLKGKAIAYSVNIVQYRNELLNSKTLKIDFDYFDNTYKKKDGEIFYRNHSQNVKTFFKRLCKDSKNQYKFKDYEDVHYKEYTWFKKCKNGGLTYLKEKGKYENTFGYDFKMSYPTDMADIAFQMPTKSGKEKIIAELPESKFVSFGIYRVSIKCDDKDFKKVFTINDLNYYTSYSLKFAMKLKSKFDITIKLIKDSEPNAYIYDRKDLISGNKLFGNWYHRLAELKKELPKNGLIKLLASSGWGHIQEAKLKYVDEPELIEMINNGSKIAHDGEDLDYIIADLKMVGDRTRYALLNANKSVYDLPFRLLPFITSFSRVKMGNLINKHNIYDKVIRIQTDSITMSEKFNENVKGFISDDKISGNLNFKNLNDYESY